MKRFWEVAKERFGDSYTYEKFEYLGALTKTTVTCRIHGDFTTKPSYIVEGNGCPTCGKIKGGLARANNLEEFVQNAKKKHGDVYDYSKTVYRTNNKTPVEIVCAIHGSFWQRPDKHTHGEGCPECANDGKRRHNYAVRDSLAEGKILALKMGFPEYDFSEAVYTGGNKKIKVKCGGHGVFFSTPNGMLSGGTGCPHCGVEKARATAISKRLTTEEWVKQAQQIHGDRYDYSETEYTHERNGKMKVRCKEHGYFFTTRDHVGQSTGCQRCAFQLSRQEDVIAGFLSKYTTVLQRDRDTLRRKEIDIYLPEKKIAIEYHGVYWHSHGDPEDEARRKDKHYDKYKECERLGIRLVSIYEPEWVNNPAPIRRLLRSILGKIRGRIYARDCEVRKVPHADAVLFFSRYHIQGGKGAGDNYGLYWKDKLVACMRFTFGGNDRGNVERTWTLSRYATRISVVGGASRLFTAFIREVSPTYVKSFSDNRYFNGYMYEKLGFVLDAELPPDYQVWSSRTGLRHKADYQRREIPARLIEHKNNEIFDPETDPRTEAEMTYLMGARRIYDCGKKRWVWRA